MGQGFESLRRGHNTVTAAMKRSPNPMDPLDDVKRWYSELWPMQRVGFWAAITAAVVLLLMYVTR